MIIEPTTYNYVKKSRTLLYILVLTLVFEGIIRKLAPSFIGVVIFFIKDVLCIYALIILLNLRFIGPLAWLNKAWKVVSILFIPLLLYTSFYDLPLGLFAAKQYLLYAVVGLLVPLAFPPQCEDNFKRFCTHFTLLIVPTSLIAILQNSLPASHWLNLSVVGDSLEGFSAVGYLRVSSTFSFTGQYSWFLNAVYAFLLFSFLNPSAKTKHQLSWLRLSISISLCILFLLGAFITGGRTAVLGTGVSLCLGFLLSTWRTPSITLTRGVGIGSILIFCFNILSEIKPEYFAAYSARSSGSDKQSHNQEIAERVLGGYTDWLDWFWIQDTHAIWLGNGLGVMSNGADKISTYANMIRSDGTWTEIDLATSAWEGGLYLLFVWYSFRLAILWFCFKHWTYIKNKKYVTGSAFLLANVIITGLMSTIGMQPPLAIWWWLSVGSVIAIYQFDKFGITQLVKKKMTLQSIKSE